MKIKSITIEGMHNVSKKTYTFKDITYLVGRNGAGKSTVLEAIQLALLGYIPGYGKTNSDIFKHSSARAMGVKLKLDDEGEEITIDRTWIGGASVKSEVKITPEGYDIASIIKDIELPIFNFDEFKNMTANKLKEWFINFLPNAEGEIDWADKLSSVRDAGPLDEDLFDNTLDKIEELSKQYRGVELVKKINDYFKEEESFLKGQSATYRGTIDSLIHYDDVEEDLTEEEVQAKISELYDLKNKYAEHARLEAEIYRLKSVADEATNKNLGLPFVGPSDDKAILDKRDSLNNDMIEVEKKLNSARSDAADKAAALKLVSKVVQAGDICPYSGVSCESISAKVASAKKDEAKAQKEYDAANKLAQDLGNEVNRILSEIAECNAKFQQIQNTIELRKKYTATVEEATTQYTDLQNKLPYILPEDAMPLEEIDSAIAENMEILKKVVANKRYNEIMDDVASKKSITDDSLDIMKAWVKLTGANGMQTQMMDGPFIALADDMSTYLTQMFGKPVTAKFNLSEKANSFSFGLERDESYIAFDVLSSGERCLYTLAMMLCIMNRCNTKLRLVIIDDLLDHLDGPNMKFTFKSLQNISKDVQIILAGVQPCGIEEIQVSVE